ncbi:MAG TPA: hypothetical protein VKR61_03145 [Bryobacteraceae bacterium]|nr:hypothetical protein [Bryobacteraceae bacterium]
MLRKLGIPTLVLAGALMAIPASAAVRFGVRIGGPYYAPAYPYYTYCDPYYGCPSYPYVYPHAWAYGGWGWHHGWHRHYYVRRWR